MKNKDSVLNVFLQSKKIRIRNLKGLQFKELKLFFLYLTL
jgi:hypothetical protein